MQHWCWRRRTTTTRTAASTWLVISPSCIRGKSKCYLLCVWQPLKALNGSNIINSLMPSAKFNVETLQQFRFQIFQGRTLLWGNRIQTMPQATSSYFFADAVGSRTITIVICNDWVQKLWFRARPCNSETGHLRCLSTAIDLRLPLTGRLIKSINKYHASMACRAWSDGRPVVSTHNSLSLHSSIVQVSMY